MRKSVKITLFAFAAAATVFATKLAIEVSASAVDSELSSDQTDTISSSCQTLKQNLKTIQRTDSRARSYLGSVYQALLVNYITPLNLSLVKHNRPSTTITRLYSDILDARSDFADKFTSYSQSYEELLNIDCQNNPGVFYDKLESVRTSRATLNSSAKHLRTLFGNFYTATSRLKEDV
ncbi:hypothetical protein IJJ18_01640 [Candidatus Saccharibacteria bacterium]|nr:hypothetical protein [Candidatus Saccharibacteria bacterium]